MSSSAAGSSSLRRGPLRMHRALRPGHVAALVLALATGAAGCNPKVVGNGVWDEREYAAPPFDRLSVSLGFQAMVQVVSGPDAARRVFLSGDENVIQEIELEVVDGALTMSAGFPVESVHPLQLRITTLELSSIEARDGSAVEASGVTAGAFSVRAVEGSRVVLSGSPGPAATLSATLDAGSRLDAHAFPVAAAAVAVTSHSYAELLCAGPVTGEASGGSTVFIRGDGTCDLTLAPDGTRCLDAGQAPP